MIAIPVVPLLLIAAGTISTDSPAPESQDQAVQVRLDEGGDYSPGHDAQVDVRPKYDGFLLVLHVDPQGKLRVLFPLEPFDEAFVEGGKGYELVNRGGRGSFYVEDADGIGAVFAAHSDWPFHVNAFAKDHRWDYEALWIPPEGDVETALVDLVSKMSYDGWFEYDLVEYEVYGEGSYAGGGPTYNIYTEPYSICCQTAVGASIFIGAGYYYPPGYPWYFSSYWYYPSHYYYRPYYGHRPSYGYPYYRERYAGGYPRGRDYRFKPQYRYDRGRSTDQYRPRIGVDAGRQASAGGSIDYRGRRSPSATPAVSPRRRTVTPVTTAGGSSPGLTRPSGWVGSRRTGSSPLVADRPRTAGLTPRGRAGTPPPRADGRTRSRPGGRAGTPAPRTGTRTSGTASEPRPNRPSLGRPVLKRSQPPVGRRTQSRPDKGRTGRTASSGRTPSPRASRPSSPPSRGRASRPTTRSRPQARSGGASRRSGGARAPSRSPARSGGSRRKP
jgi:hypothetical protein